MLKLLNALAPLARPRKPATRAYWAQDAGADRDVRFTPPQFMNHIYAVWGVPDLDPCGHPKSPVRAGRRIIPDEGGDGLTEPWTGAFAFMNPPFSQMLRWLRRAEEEWRRGNVAKVVALVPARLDASWFHDHLRHVADFWILRGRLRFWTTEGQGNQAPYPVMVVMLGVSEKEIELFTRIVAGAWFAPRINRSTTSVVDENVDIDNR